MLFYKGAHADKVCNDELQTKAKNIVRLINTNKLFCRHHTETPEFYGHVEMKACVPV